MLEAVFSRKLRDFELNCEVDLGPGEILALTGENGAGKTTILNILAGLLQPDFGLITLGGKTLFDSEMRICSPPEQRNIGYVFQHYALFPHLSVFGNITFGLRRKGVSHGEAAVRVGEILDLMGISSLSDLPVTALSGGQRQRVALARALVMKPSLLLLDEPFAALDSAGHRKILEEMATIIHAAGIPTIMVTHSPDDARLMGDRILRIDRGLVVGEERVGYAGVTLDCKQDRFQRIPACQKVRGNLTL